MVHAALLLLMLEAVTKDLVFTISLKRSTQNLQLSTNWAGRLPHLRLLPAGAVAGWGLHPLESAAFARRTPNPEVAVPISGIGIRLALALIVSRHEAFSPQILTSGRGRCRAAGFISDCAG